MTSVLTSIRSIRARRRRAALWLLLAPAFACNEKQGTTRTTGTESSTGADASTGTGSPTDGGTPSTGATETSTGDAVATTGNPFCDAAPSTPCGDYFGTAACCVGLDAEAGSFYTEDCVAYTADAPGDCGALVTAAVACLAALPCEAFGAFQTAYHAGDAAWQTTTCGGEVQAAVAADCTAWWPVGVD